jgi:hypothetical protein
MNHVNSKKPPATMYVVDQATAVVTAPPKPKAIADEKKVMAKLKKEILMRPKSSFRVELEEKVKKIEQD